MGTKITKVVSGGEAGVERAALYFAELHGITYGGWAAMGGLAEDLGQWTSLFGRFPHLVEVQSVDPGSSLRLNVEESDATLIILPALTPCERATLAEEAALALGRPYLVTTGSNMGEVTTWLDTLPTDVTLHIVGPKNSEAPTAYDTAFFLLQDLLEAH